MANGNNCEYIIRKILPKTGEWRISHPKMIYGINAFYEENVPYHACDIEWLKEYIKSFLFRYDLVVAKSILLFLESYRFKQIVSDYQNNIVDWQISYSRITHPKEDVFHMCEDAELKYKMLCEDVMHKLTAFLNMDREIVRNRLIERKSDVVESFLEELEKMKKLNLLNSANSLKNVCVDD